VLKTLKLDFYVIRRFAPELRLEFMPGCGENTFAESAKQ
jgi:hypothetical protein